MQRIRALFSRSNWFPTLGVISLLGFTVLSIGLRGLKFAPGRHLGRAEPDAIGNSLQLLTRGLAAIPVWKLVTTWVMLCMIVALIASLLAPEARRRIVRALVRFGATVFIILYILQNNPNIVSFLRLAVPVGRADAGPPAGGLPQAAFQPPHVSPLIAYVISLGLMLAVLAAGWALSRWWMRRRAASTPVMPLNELARMARVSLDDVVGGRDWGNAVIRCYDQMARVVDKRRGLLRTDSMTAAEFASRLESAGLPREPVSRLTHLFERARYGTRQPVKSEIDEAVSSLRAIAVFCGEIA